MKTSPGDTLGPSVSGFHFGLRSQLWLPAAGTGGPEALSASSWLLHYFPHHPCSFLESWWECEFPTGSLLESKVTVETASFVTDTSAAPHPQLIGLGIFCTPSWLGLDSPLSLTVTYFSGFPGGVGQEGL